MKLRKRLISGLLSLTMCLSLLPSAAFATEDIDLDADVPVASSNEDEGESVSVTGITLEASTGTIVDTWTADEVFGNGDTSTTAATLDEAGTLTISGTGDMINYEKYSLVPWYSCSSSITAVVIEDGVTGIGNYAFYYCTSLTEVTIPDSVTSIGNSAFYDCSSLESVTIPDNVTSIGEGAFYWCSSLSSVTIPKDVTSIGDGAFEGCTGLTSISVAEGNGYYCSDEDGVLFNQDKTTLIIYPASKSGSEYIIPSSVTSIGNYAFDHCEGLTSVTIPDSVETIGNDAFSGCSSLTSVTIPDSVTSIGDSAFSNCGLTSVTISNGVTSIGNYAFSSCTSLKSVTIPSSVTSIGDKAFEWCTSLTSIGVAEGNSYYCSEDGVLFNQDKTTLITYPANKPESEYTIPSSVTTIGDVAFYFCEKLGRVTIPDSVETIGKFAFSNCGLTTVTFEGTTPPSTIGYLIFFKCPYLSVIYVPEGSVDAYKEALSSYADFIRSASSGDCGETLTWTLDGDGVLTISGAGAMTDWSHPSDVPWRDSRDGITGVVIEDGVTNIGNYAFSRCSGLTSVSIPDSVTSIGRGAFSGCENLTGVTIPDGVTSIGDDAFSNSGLTSVTIPGNITSIGDSTFSSCEGLTSVTIPDSVEIIENYAFYYCKGLTEVTIPDSVTSIGKGAFSLCHSLESVTIPSSVTSIGNDAFGSCYKLAGIEVDENNNFYCDVEGVLFNEEQTTLIQCPANKSGSEYIIPGSVNTIGDDAFSSCENLTSVTIPDSVTNIGESAFSGCSSLTSITIPKNVTSIGEYAFRVCNDLTSIEVDENNNYYCDVDGVLFNEEQTTLIQYPTNKSAYEYAIPDGVTVIGDDAFSGCSSLTEVTIPGSVTSIGSEAFSACWNLSSVTIPDSITSIGDSAFWNCTNLANVTFKGSTPPGTVGYEIFGFCGALTAIYVPADNVDTYKEKLSDYEDKIQGASGVVSYTVNVSASPAKGGTVSGAETGTYPENTEVTVTAKANTGYQFVKWTENGEEVSTNASYNFTITANRSLVAVFEEKNSSETIGGKCGENLTWTLTENGKDDEGNPTYTLTISGTGAMTDYTSSDPAPWYDSRDSITTVVIENGVTSIGNDAFYYCTSLTGVILPNSVKTIGEHSFSDCQSLTSVTIPNSVKTIGNLAFSYCGLTSVTIPDSVTSIEPGAFYHCSNLTSATFEGATPPANTGYVIFYECEALKAIYVPAGSVEAYKNVPALADYAHLIRAIPDAGDDSQPISLTLDHTYALLQVNGANNTFTLTANVQPDGAAVTWKVDDNSNVVTLNSSGKTCTVTANAVGTTDVIATVTIDGAEYSAHCHVDVTSATPAQEITDVYLTTTKVTSYIHSTNYAQVDVQFVVGNKTEPEPVNKGNGNTDGSIIDSVAFKDKTTSELFEIEVVKGATQTLQIKPKNLDKIKKSSYKSKVEVTIGGEPYETQELTIAVKKDEKPKVKASAVKLNSFYKGYTADLVFTCSDGEVTGVTLNGNDLDWLKLNEDMTVSINDKGYEQKKSGKLNLMATVSGYGEQQFPVTVSVSATKTNPKVKLSASSVTMYSGTEGASNGLTLSLSSSNKKVPYEELDITGLNVTKDYTGNYEVKGFKPETGEFILRVKDGGKVVNETVPLEVIFDGGRGKMPLSLKVKASNKKPTLKLSKSSITLNPHMGEGVDLYKVTLNVTPADYVIEGLDDLDITVKEGKDEVTKNVLSFGLENNVLTVKTTGETPKDKAHTYKVSISLSDVENPKAVTLTVKTSKAGSDASISGLTAKGTIDVSRLDNSSIILTPKYKNYNGFNKDVTVKFTIDETKKGNSKAEPLSDDWFNVVPNSNGTYTLKFTDKAKLNLDSKYTAKVSVNFGKGDEEKEVKLTVKKGTVKVTQDVKAIELFKVDPYSEGFVTLSIADETVMDIADVKLQDKKNDSKFEVKHQGNGKCVIGFKDDSAEYADKAKNGTVKLDVYLKGNGGEKANATVSVKVNVK